MSKVCPACGVKHKNSAYNCMSCGTPFPSGRTYPDFFKYSKYIFGAVVLVALVVALSLHFLSPETAARRIMNAYRINDVGAVVRACPDFFLESDMLDIEAFIDDMGSSVNQLSELSFGYRVEKTASPSSKEYEALLEQFYYFGGYDFDEDDIKDIKIVWIDTDLEIEGSIFRFVMIKYGGRWCWWPSSVA